MGTTDYNNNIISPGRGLVVSVRVSCAKMLILGLRVPACGGGTTVRTQPHITCMGDAALDCHRDSVEVADRCHRHPERHNAVVEDGL